MAPPSHKATLRGVTAVCASGPDRRDDPIPAAADSLSVIGCHQDQSNRLYFQVNHYRLTPVASRLACNSRY